MSVKLNDESKNSHKMYSDHHYCLEIQRKEHQNEKEIYIFHQIDNDLGQDEKSSKYQNVIANSDYSKNIYTNSNKMEEECQKEMSFISSDHLKRSDKDFIKRFGGDQHSQLISTLKQKSMNKFEHKQWNNKINSQKEEQSNLLFNGVGVQKMAKTILKQDKKKKRKTQFKRIEICPRIQEQLVFLLKGNVLLELNRNFDDQDYVPIGLKMNPQNQWKPIQKVIEHQKHQCIEIQVGNIIKPLEDFSFIIQVLNSYGERKYHEIAQSLEKYSQIINTTKRLEKLLPPQISEALKKEKNQKVNTEEFDKAFYDQFYLRAMDVLGSMNQESSHIFFGFVMGKFDKFGFFEDMYNFGVNKNFLLLLGSEMNSMSNVFMRNGWLEIFDQETRIQNSLNFITLINHEYESEFFKQKQNEEQNINPSILSPLPLNKLSENISESVDIVVNTFDQIKIPGKLKIHDIKVNYFGLRITAIDISPNMVQQVHAIRQKYITENKHVNYIQMFDKNLTYTSKSQEFLEKFYPHHYQFDNKTNSTDVTLLPSVRSAIKKMRCSYREVPN